jgi:hypothetical protein
VCIDLLRDVGLFVPSLAIDRDLAVAARQGVVAAAVLVSTAPTMGARPEELSARCPRATPDAWASSVRGRVPPSAHPPSVRFLEPEGHLGQVVLLLSALFRGEPWLGKRITIRRGA